MVNLVIHSVDGGKKWFDVLVCIDSWAVANGLVGRSRDLGGK